jgi:hypothetical protein
MYIPPSLTSLPTMKTQPHGTSRSYEQTHRRGENRWLDPDPPFLCIYINTTRIKFYDIVYIVQDGFGVLERVEKKLFQHMQ